MPRGKGRKIQQKNPAFGDLFRRVIDSVVDVKKLEMASTENIKKILSDDSGISAEGIKDLMYDVMVKFRIDPDLKTEPKVYPPPARVDKRRSYDLPPFPENTIFRVVVVHGSHELFHSIELKSIIGDESVFVPQGSAFKTTPSNGNFYYDDRSYYDKDKYPGKGFKRPENRTVIVFDFTTDDEDLKKKYQSGEIDKAAGKLSKEITGGQTPNPGLIQNLLKLFGGSKGLQ